MNESSFPSANGAPYNFSEIWPFPINGGGESSSGGRLELRRPPFAADISRFAGEAEVVADPDASGNDSMNGGGRSARRRRDVDEEAAAKSVSTSSGNGVNGSDSKRLKTSGSGDENQSSKAEGEGNSGKGVDQTEPPKDYIHVRARRGQATDSHSLAERARREKISERMKLLQDLVPGCNKVIGKALVLDEIINYIQSLQRQVELTQEWTLAWKDIPPKILCNQKGLILQRQHINLKLLENSTEALLQNGYTCRLVAALSDKHNSFFRATGREKNKEQLELGSLTLPFMQSAVGTWKSNTPLYAICGIDITGNHTAFI